MNIDVIVTSCSRPDVLDITIKSFKKYLKTEHDLRWVIVDDFVKDDKRREKGRNWIKKNEKLFDEIVLHKGNFGKGRWWQESIKYCKSDYHIHLEDDNEFIRTVKIDPVVNYMVLNDDVLEVIFSRGKLHKRVKPNRIKIENMKLTEMDSVSMASGLYNTKNVRTLFDNIGWDEIMHEAGNLAPMSKKLGYKKFMMGHGNKHYNHIGAQRGYKKGAWKK